jgi:hypothetical protein
MQDGAFGTDADRSPVFSPHRETGNSTAQKKAHAG